MRNWQELLAELPQTGRLRWIGVRPARGAVMRSLSEVRALAGRGLEGDRYAGGRGGRGARQVTLLQYEHLAAIGGMLGVEPLAPELLRRNLVVSGINLLALKQRRFRLGGALLEFSGLCHPCSKMETALGPGGLNAMRGHGGINARILESGLMRLEDTLVALTPEGGQV